MGEPVRIGIVICDRYRTCAGGKRLRAVHTREGAFERYEGKDPELVGFTTCNGCPGGNAGYVPQKMKNNGAGVIHPATGMIAGYPPCPRISYFSRFIKEKFGMDVVIGTHSIPQIYYLTHQKLGSCVSGAWLDRIAPTLTNEKTRLAND